MDTGLRRYDAVFMSIITPPLWHSSDLAAILGIPAPCPPWQATGISIDSRTLQAGDLFIAIEGPNFDGNQYVEAALQAGASGVLTTRPCNGANCLTVLDTTLAMNQLAAHARARFHGPVIGITGSVGKTTAKEMLHTCLGGHATIGNLNNHYGVPLTLMRLPPEAPCAIIEMGMNAPGEIAPLSKLSKPDIALITAIAPAHLEAFDNIDGIAREKASIAEGLAHNGTLVVPAKHPLLAVTTGNQTLCTFALDAPADYTAENISYSEQGCKADILTPHGKMELRVRSVSKAAIYNAVATVAVVGTLDNGNNLQAAADKLLDWSPLDGRGKINQLPNNITVIDESYNANPLAMNGAIQMLARLQGERRIAVLGDMLELGPETQKFHRDLTQPLADHNIDLVFAVGRHMRGLYDDLPNAQRGSYSEDAATIMPQLQEALRPGDVVLVKGSAGIGLKAVVNGLQGTQ